jgi:hypothetical protein
MLQELGLIDVVFDGRAVGLESHHGASAGLPIRKPWRIATDIAELREDLGAFQCPGPSSHPEHAPCMGRDTVDTGFYTDALVDVIHSAFRRHMANKCSPAAVALERAQQLHDAVCKQLSVDALLQAYNVDPARRAWVAANILEQPAQGQHRERHGRTGFWNAMVTTTLPPWDPRSRTPAALKAVDEELAAPAARQSVARARAD